MGFLKGSHPSGRILSDSARRVGEVTFPTRFMVVMGRKMLIRKAFIKSVPVLAAYFVLGMGFGILMSSKGYGPLWSVACSLFIYAGAMQYVTVDLLVTAVSPIQAAFMTVMVNARHLFYGISMIEKYRDMGKFKPYLIFGLTDETYSLLCDSEDYPAGKDAGLYCFLVTVFDQSYWVIGSVVGAILGTVIKFDSTGIDFSMTALFLTVFVDQWQKSKRHLPALAGIGITLLCLLIFGSGSFLIPSMLFITVFLSVPYIKGVTGHGRF